MNIDIEGYYYRKLKKDEIPVLDEQKAFLPPSFLPGIQRHDIDNLNITNIYYLLGPFWNSKKVYGVQSIFIEMPFFIEHSKIKKLRQLIKDNKTTEVL